MPASPARISQDRHRSTGFLLLYALAYTGGVVAYLPLLTLLLPLKIEALAGEARIGVFSATIIAGALAASGANVLFGWLSDRSVARGQGRRRWLCFGLIATVLSYAAVAAAASSAAIILAVTLFQVAVNAMLAPLLAIMADEVPDAQKGVAGGLLAAAVPVASGVSAALVGMRLLPEAERLTIVAAAVFVCVTPLLATRARKAIVSAPQPTEMEQRRRDLVVTWAARLLAQVAGNALSLYLLYYFESIVPDAEPEDLAPRVGHLLTIVYVLSLPAAVAAGRMSDHFGRRKPTLVAGASLASVGLVMMAFAADWRWAALGFAAYAIGSAVFLTLHAAFAMQLLPDPAHRGRDLGLLNLTNTLPALLGPLLTWSLATPQDFGAVLLTLALLTFAGGAAMTSVRSRR
ncbi:MFS transporter [uncultured Sphingomonas sp.]|uniref:MFS transporter n=1 Tax=unclassified Sphingomonas TaxID=196159 RepID=UPI0025E51313|nr:MFS transporter [uncultured Sphingomonas sp.]